MGSPEHEGTQHKIIRIERSPYGHQWGFLNPQTGEITAAGSKEVLQLVRQYRALDNILKTLSDKTGHSKLKLASAAGHLMKNLSEADIQLLISAI